MYMWRERSKEEKHEDVVNTGLLPLDVVEGFKIRPGFFRMYGACVASNGVSFTINSHGFQLLFLPYYGFFSRISLFQFTKSAHFSADATCSACSSMVCAKIP